MNRKDMFFVTGLCFLSAIVGGLLVKELPKYDAFAESGKEFLIATNEKNAKSVLQPTTDFIATRPVSTSTPDFGQILKWDGYQWALTTDNMGVLEFHSGDIPLIELANECSKQGTTWTKKKEVQIGNSGTLKIKFDMRTHNTKYAAYGQIYKNDVAIGTIRSTNSASYETFVEDISDCLPGDKIQLYIKNEHSYASTSVQNFGLYVDAKHFNTTVTMN